MLPPSTSARQRRNGAFPSSTPGGKLTFRDQTPASHPASTSQSCRPDQTKAQLAWRRFHEPIWHAPASWPAGCVRKHPKQRLNLETYCFVLHFKGRAALVPTLSCHHVLTDVRLSPASDVDPAVALQRACKTMIFLERDEKARGCPGTGSMSKGETQKKKKKW